MVLVVVLGVPVTLRLLLFKRNKVGGVSCLLFSGANKLNCVAVIVVVNWLVGLFIVQNKLSAIKMHH